MTATAAMLAQVKRMVDEPTTDNYTNDEIDGYIEMYPLLDALGTDPHEVDFTTTPPTISLVDEWISTYDLNAAAANIWEEKAAAVADEFDFKADGGSYSREQKFDMYMKKARFHLSRRSAKTSKMWIEPRRIHSQEEV